MIVHGVWILVMSCIALALCLFMGVDYSGAYIGHWYYFERAGLISKLFY